MKIIQLNVWWGSKLSSSVKAFLEDEQPDIVCLQEAVSAENGDTGMFFSVEEMQTSALPYLTFAPLISFRFMHQLVSFGNAILSRTPIVESDFIYTNLEHNKDFDFSKHDYNVRNLLHCVIDSNGKKVHILTHHGHHVPHHKNGDEDTLRQMKQIAEYIETLSGPVILTGDFNLAPHSKSLSIINERLTNLSIEYKLKTTRTSLSPKNEVCDYIFLNDAVHVTHFEASEKVVSDHKALITEIEL